jgi:hypothetical protein
MVRLPAVGMPEGIGLLRQRLTREETMPKKTLDPEALRIETFATTPACAPPADHAKMSAATSCPIRPPYCTC